LLVQALIERELRRAMEREQIEELLLYPEERSCRRPTVLQILRLFSLIERHALKKVGELIQAFPPQFTDLQSQVLRLLELPENAYN
jgi:hypothetical protein